MQMTKMAKRETIIENHNEILFDSLKIVFSVRMKLIKLKIFRSTESDVVFQRAVGKFMFLKSGVQETKGQLR